MARALTPGAQAWRLGPSYTYDFLVESFDLDLHWSYSTIVAGGYTWEQRLLTISEIELSVPPGGGLASAQTVTITVAESDTGQSLRATWNEEGRMQGADLSVSLLPAGEAYGSRLRLFTGKIDSVAWRAGASPGDGVGTLIAVDDTLHKNIQVPGQILTVQGFPNLPEPWQGAILPMIYGNSAKLLIAPLLLLDTATLVYRAADHAMGSMGSNHALVAAESGRLLPLGGAGTSVAASAVLTLDRPVTENRYAIAGQTGLLTHQQGVTNPANALDGNAGTFAQIGTGAVVNGEGQGRLAVKYTWAQNPDGANTALIMLSNHRRNPAAATTVTAELLVRSLDPVTNAVQRDTLFRDGPYRHSATARTRHVTVAPLAVASPAALEVELEVLNEGGAGGINDYWIVGDLDILLYYQAESLLAPVYLYDPWDGVADTTGLITGVPGSTLVQAVDVLRSILTARLQLAVSPVSFPLARGLLSTYAGTYRYDFGLGSGGWYQTQMLAAELLDTLALQAGCYLFPAGDGSTSISVSRGTLVSQVALTIANMANVHIDLGRLEMVHSTYEVHYGWSVTLQRFTRVALATPELCTHGDPATATDLFVKCNDSWQRYGPQEPYVLQAYAIQDDATASTVLAHLVNYHWTQQLIVTCDIPFVGIHLEVGDYVTITHPELPTNENGTLFEVVRLTHRPEDHQGTSWPIQLVALRTTLTTFDYFAVQDQTGIVWYWWVNRAGDLDWSLTPPSTPTRVAHNMNLSPLPSWFEVVDPDGNTRYIYPTAPTGAPDVEWTQPPNGTGYQGSPTVRGMGLDRWYLDVPLTREILILRVRPSFDYFAINDQTHTTWYWWITRAGEVQWGLTVPSFDERIAVNLNIIPIPYWLVLHPYYVYPSSTTGEPLSTTSPPALGTGYPGSPVLRSAGTGSWMLTVTPAGDLTPVPMEVLAHFDYFVMLDQSGVSWHWWVNQAGELAWSLAVPSVSAKTAHNLGLTPTPWWLALDSYYVYPSQTTGEPLSSTIPPATGTGMTGSPIVRSAGSGTWILTVSAAGNVIPVLT